MKDGIIKATGNSRLLKAPETIPATYAEFRTALLAGNLPVDLLYNAAGWEVEGTALNKANLLTDTVAEALGLSSSDPTVNEALNALLAVATTLRNGLMSAGDKSKLDGVANNANNYVHPTTAGNKHIPTGGSVDSILGYSASGAAIWIQQLAIKSLLESATQALYGVSNVDAALRKIPEYTGYKCVTYTSNGTFVAPANVNSVILLGCAAGGPGSASGRGKAGEAAIYKKVTVTPGQSYAVTVGNGNTVFGALLTLLANNLAIDAGLQWGGTKLGLSGLTGAAWVGTADPCKPPGFESLSPGNTFKLHGIKELAELNFKIGTISTGGFNPQNLYPGYGGYFGFGGSTIAGDSSVGGSGGGFGAGGGGNSSLLTPGAGSPGFLVVMYKEGQ